MNLPSLLLLLLKIELLLISSSCSPGLTPAVHSLSPSLGAREKTAPRQLQRQLRAIKIKTDLRTFVAGKSHNPEQQIRRIRRSLVENFLDDLWDHVRDSIPRSALYAIPITSGIMFLLCCFTVLVDDPTQ
ncbi:small integral membrane protein 9 [Tachyglossus aculeatus]|uniref:small integral membrane protein 9 n=1 Tax=Tachyglossus aculeatus TaxID=9261 RepID=UPI0018F69D75|nr:small integral membrane protein 9 [Tachyglossus aculeatus]XP_038604287.1 small integral membrane protein 9 [Tachyglossus aculeatus]XP_038604288.1 small integral membrane protein 9 [Tachyglossus aculeatus]